MRFIIGFLFSFLFLLPASPKSQESLILKKEAVSSLGDGMIVPDLKSVTVDHHGNVFAFAGKANGRECFVVKFDHNLNYMTHFGRAGRGPAEFTTQYSSPRKRISVDQNGNVYVVDYNPTKLVVFDNNGKYLKDIPLMKEYGDILGTVYDVKKTSAGFSAMQYKRDQPPDVIIFDIDPLKIKVRYSFVEKRIRASNISYDSLYYGRRCIVESNLQFVAFCHTQIYKFQVYNEKGELALEVFDQNRSLNQFSSEEMRYIEKEFFTPSIEYSVIRNDSLRQLKANRSLYGKIMKQIKKGKNLICDIKLSGDNVFLFPVDDDITQERWPVLIYNLKAKIIKKGYFKELPARIDRNHAFFYERNEEDDPLIVKYKLEGL